MIGRTVGLVSSVGRAPDLQLCKQGITGSGPASGTLSMPKGYIVFVRSVVRSSLCPPVRPVHPGVIPSVNLFYNQVLLRSFLITYNSAATGQKLFIFGMEVPGRVLFHSTSVDSWVMAQGGARGHY